MTLLELLVQELPKRGGWPKNAKFAVQDSFDGFSIKFVGANATNLRIEDADSDTKVWMCDTWGYGSSSDFNSKIQASDFSTAIIKKQQYEDALAASKQPEWNGEHLPPVGTHCEYLSEKNGWVICEILLYRKSIVVMETDLNGAGITINRIDECQFRPIRTEAERKREQAKNILAEICRSSASNGHSADLIYDSIAAGKIPGIKLAD